MDSLHSIPILSDESLIVNKEGSWPVVDLVRSWQGKYKVYGSFYANNKWNWTSVRNTDPKEWIGGFHLLDPVRWRIPCANGLIAASPGWPTLYLFTKNEDVVKHFLTYIRPNCKNPTRGEYSEDGFQIRFWAEDWPVCFKWMQPLKEKTKQDLTDIPAFCESFPEKSLPDVGTPVKVRPRTGNILRKKR